MKPRDVTDRAWKFALDHEIDTDGACGMDPVLLARAFDAATEATAEATADVVHFLNGVIERLRSERDALRKSMSCHHTDAPLVRLPEGTFCAVCNARTWPPLVHRDSPYARAWRGDLPATEEIRVIESHGAPTEYAQPREEIDR